MRLKSLIAGLALLPGPALLAPIPEPAPRPEPAPLPEPVGEALGSASAIGGLGFRALQICIAAYGAVTARSKFQLKEVEDEVAKVEKRIEAMLKTIKDFEDKLEKDKPKDQPKNPKANELSEKWTAAYDSWVNQWNSRRPGSFVNPGPNNNRKQDTAICGTDLLKMRSQMKAEFNELRKQHDTPPLPPDDLDVALEDAGETPPPAAPGAQSGSTPPLRVSGSGLPAPVTASGPKKSPWLNPFSSSGDAATTTGPATTSSDPKQTYRWSLSPFSRTGPPPADPEAQVGMDVPMQNLRPDGHGTQTQADAKSPGDGLRRRPPNKSAEDGDDVPRPSPGSSSSKPSPGSPPPKPATPPKTPANPNARVSGGGTSPPASPGAATATGADKGKTPETAATPPKSESPPPAKLAEQAITAPSPEQPNANAQVLPSPPQNPPKKEEEKASPKSPSPQKPVVAQPPPPAAAGASNSNQNKHTKKRIE